MIDANGIDIHISATWGQLLGWWVAYSFLRGIFEAALPDIVGWFKKKVRPC